MARKIHTLEQLYLDELKDLYSAETQLALALPLMAKAVQSEDLREAFDADAVQSQLHAKRLSQILTGMKQDPLEHRCKGMEGLLQEGSDLIKDGSEPALAAGLIVTAQKAQHYEIAGYGSACTFAKILGREADAKLLHQTLEEERETDQYFTQIANRALNIAAAVA